jgi:A1 cistron-splicing factor AAR2
VPKGFHFGIDYYSYQVTENFMGFKEIPKGIHYIHYSIQENSPNASFFESFEEDDFQRLSKDSELEIIYKFQKNEFFQNVAPYPENILQTWKGLSNQLTKEILSNIEPVDKKIFPISENNSESRFQIYFTEIPKISSKDKTPFEISKMNFDKSQILEEVLKKKSESFILGELQFSFIIFLIGQNYNGFEQWKKLLNLICNCDESFGKRISFFSKFISVLEFQLQITPEDFFIHDFTSHNFLTNNLISFFEISTFGQDENLKKKSLIFKQKMEKKFKFSFDELNSDDAPVIVE